MMMSFPPGMSRGNRLRAEQLSAELASLLETGTVSAVAQLGAGQMAPPDRARERCAAARTWITVRRLRDRIMGGELFADPAWDMLLDLYTKRHSGHPISISSLCIASQAPPTTALRWIARLEAAGCIVRRADPHDKRRVYAELTAETVAQLDAVLDGFAKSRA